MKRLFLVLVGAGMLAGASLLGGCGHKNKSLGEMKNASPSDSMMYYFGEMQAANFWQDAQTDTLLRDEEARNEFMKGFRAGINMNKDNSAYNKGVQLGLRLAIRLQEFEERYGIDFSEEILANSLELHLEADSVVNVVQAQKGFYHVKDRLDYALAKEQVEGAKANLAKEGKARGFTMVSDTLYAYDISDPGTGPNLKNGDRIAIEITTRTLNGEEIVARQFPDSITIGEGRIPRVVREGLYTMRNGETRSFMTTPRTLFGKRYSVYRLPYEQPVIFTVKVSRK